MPAPVESLSALALAIWSYGLRDYPQTVPELERVMDRVGVVAMGQDISAAVRELVKSGYAEPRINGWRHVRATQLTLDVQRQAEG